MDFLAWLTFAIHPKLTLQLLLSVIKEMLKVTTLVCIHTKATLGKDGRFLSVKEISGPNRAFKKTT